MSTSDLVKFNGGTQAKGVNNFSPKISTEITWTNDVNNVTCGIRQGVGPRYGAAPIPGQSDTEALVTGQNNGIMASEAASGGSGLIERELMFGIVPLNITEFAGSYPKSNHQFYTYLVGLDYSNGLTTFDACLGAFASGGIYQQESDIRSGLMPSGYREENPLVRLHKTELVNLPVSGTAADMQTILQNVPRFWNPYAHVSIPGKRVPYFWQLADLNSNGTTGVCPDMAITGPIVWADSYGGHITLGSSSEMITREAKDNNTRIMLVYGLDGHGFGVDRGWTERISDANTVAVTGYNPTTWNYVNLTDGSTFGSDPISGVAAAIILDPGNYTNSRHEAVLVGLEKPLAIVYQDWRVMNTGLFPRYVDLSSPGCLPRNSVGIFGIGGNVSQESAFVRESDCVVPNEDDAGILAPGFRYDIGFSYYNKLLDFESNVAFGTTVSLADLDPDVAGPRCVCACKIAASGQLNLWEGIAAGSIASETVPWEFSDTRTTIPASIDPDPRYLTVNDYQIKFYYRQTGSGEWLPAGSFDAAQYWYATNWETVGVTRGPMICRTPQGGLPGGQPSGFIDYSPLPKQRYVNVINFQNRAFWFAEKTMHFSLQNNIYAYPQRNITVIPAGFWKGGLEHTRTGDVQQNGRLLMFGSNATYAGRFTGERLKQNVRISADTVGQFDIDGSDFAISYLTDATAYCARASCVAEGIAYWWGIQGVYADDGINRPEKISQVLEPEVQTFVALERQDEVHCVYNKNTKEVLWFYPPKVPDSSFPTYVLIYNVLNDEFYYGKMRCQVDASQNLKVTDDSTPEKLDGDRVLIHCRESTSATVSRSYFFDQLVQAGEQGPGRELLIKTVATPSAGVKRLTIASGSVGVTAGSIAANDYVSFQNVKGYATTITNATDMIAKIVAVNNGAGTIDIQLPTGGALDDATLVRPLYFPIYQKKPTTAGLHGIIYTIPTNYWLPTSAPTIIGAAQQPQRGMSESWNWMYLYFLFRYLGIPTPTNPFTDQSATSVLSLAYRTLVSGGEVTDLLTLINNSDDQCQVHHPLRNEERSANGQALKYSLSGIHIGDPWTLEYLEAHCLKEKGFTLKEFEG